MMLPNAHAHQPTTLHGYHYCFPKLCVDVVVRCTCVYLKKTTDLLCVITVYKESKYREPMMCCNYPESSRYIPMLHAKHYIQSCFCQIASSFYSNKKTQQMDGLWASCLTNRRQASSSLVFFKPHSFHLSIFHRLFFSIVCFARWKHQVSFSPMKNGGKGAM